MDKNEFFNPGWNFGVKIVILMFLIVMATAIGTA